MSNQLRLAFVLEAVDKATAKVRAVRERVDKLNEPARRVRASFNALNEETDRFGRGALREQLGTITEKTGRLAATVAGLVGGFTAATVAAGGVFWALKRTIDQVDTMADTSKKLGIATQQYQRLGYAAQLNGSSQEEMGAALQFLSQNMVEAVNGSKEAALWFDRVGIPLQQLKKMNAVQVFEAIADKFAAVGDAGQNAEKKIAVMRALMGRGGAELKQVLDQGSAGLKKFYDEADRLGVVLDTATVEAMGDFNDNFDRLKFSIFGVMSNIARVALPALDAMVQRFTKLNVASRGELGERLGHAIGEIVSRLPGFLAGVGQIGEGMAKVAVWADRAAQAIGGWENVIMVVAALIGMALVAQVVSLGLSIAGAVPLILNMISVFRFAWMPVIVAATKLLWGMAAAWLATPFGQVVAGILLVAAGAALLIKYWEPIKAWFSDLWDSIASGAARVAGLLPAWMRPGGAPGGGTALATPGPAVVAPSAVPGPAAGAAGRTEVGGTLKIEIDSTGRPQVKSLASLTPAFGIDVYSGTMLVGN